MKLQLKRIISLISIPLLAAPAYANHETQQASGQTINSQVLSSVDPGLLSKKLIEEPAGTPHRPLPTTTIEPPKEVSSKSLQGEHFPFYLNKIIITGNKAIPDQQLESLYQHYLHQKITLQQIFTLANQITNIYKQKGYILSRAVVPPQTIKDGIVTIQVIEGSVNKVKIEGAVPEKPAAIIKGYGQNIVNDKPITYATLERNLLLINDVPGIETNAVLGPDPTVPQTSELSLASKYKPAQASIAYDNFGSRYFGPNQTTLNTSLNSIFTPGGTLFTRTVITSRTRELQFFDVHHDQLIGSDGLNLRLGTFYADTHPDFILEPLEIHGISKSLYSSVSYPLIRSQTENLKVNTDFSYLNSSGSSFGTPLYLDRTRSITIGGHYDDIAGHGVNNIDLKFSHGFNILGASNDSTLRSRADGVSDFKTVNLTLSREQFFTQRYSLFGLLTGQYTWSPLLSAQEMVFGGAYLGRGFDVAQFSGDRGIAGTAEFRIHTQPSSTIFKSVQYYTFCDSATLWNIDSNATPQQTSATSVGAGIRANLYSHFTGNLFIAKPLHPGNATQDIIQHNSKSASAYFQLVAYI